MKKRVIILVSILMFGFTMPLFEGCTSSNQELSIPSEFANQIAAYTSGIISKHSPIRIQLLSKVAELITSSEDLDEEILTFNPKIEGKLNWDGTNTLEFVPDEPLPQNTHYQAIFSMAGLSKKLKTEKFVFDFKTIEQAFEVNVLEQKTIDLKKLHWQSASGKLQTADGEDIDKIKSVLTAVQNDKKLAIKWTEEQGNEFKFVIDSIQRKEKSSEVTLMWDGKPIGAKKTGQKVLEIPSYKDFKFLDAYIIHSPEQYVHVQFSDPLQADQDLSGLIRLGETSNVRYLIEDNVVKIYPNGQLNGICNVKVSRGIKNILGYKLKNDALSQISFDAMKPAVKLVNKGVILPSTKKGLVFPFEAVNLKAVDVQVIQVFENNIAQFLQVNDLSGDYEMRRVGKPVVQKTIDLTTSGVVDFNKWNKFFLDLNDLVKTEPGAIYRVSIGFRKQHSLYNCSESDEEEENNEDIQSVEQWGEQNESSYWDTYNESYYDYYWDWDHREDPCHKAYYGRRRQAAQNILASNIGVIAKRGNDNSMNVFITDIGTTKPIGNVEVDVYDYQNQVLATQSTNGDGIANFTDLKKPHLVVAKMGKQRGYLKVSDGSSLSLSRFDIGGNRISNGLKGFIYGERGVWRPGDSLFVTFILEELAEPLPEKHPIVFELKNPMGQLKKRLVQTKNKTGFYTYSFNTEDEDVTGNWNATVSVGGAKFQKTLKIETVKPNRLKIKIDFGKDYIAKGDEVNGNLNVKWLHGAVAKGLDAKVDVMFSAVKTTFDKYTDYEFDDPTKSFYTEDVNIFNAKVDETGNATIFADINIGNNAPGKLSATFVTKVFEKGGDFSIDQFKLPYYPYASFVGLKLPKGDRSRGMLLTDKKHPVDIVLLKPDGTVMKENHNIELEFYKLNWRWWWDKSNSDLINFTSRNSYTPLKRQVVQSSNGTVKWEVQVNYPEWGRYLVRAKDLVTGHSTAKVVYIDWPGWAGRQQKSHGEGASMLTFATDKDTYSVGEDVKLTLPTGKDGRALISIENGTKVLETYWLETKEGESSFTFKATKEMTPNVFVNITLLQPHMQTANDLPIRMYGVAAVKVENPLTHLHPEIKMPDVLESEKEFSVTVSERDKRDMTYTIAVVDEGLLDLTRFRTPDPWNSFYAREALGVKTWDIYDWVIGAYSGELERILSIGGDDELGNKKKKKANRFKPVVKFYGPFHTTGESKTHKITLPQYIGSVRTMVVAGDNRAYGSAEKTTPVRKPLMILGTLPRVLGPGESVKLPVSVFAMEKNIKNVTVTIKTNDILKIKGSTTKKLTFGEPGEQDIDFDLKVLSAIGIGKVEIEAVSGSEKANFSIELDVRPSNPRITNVVEGVVQAGETWKQDYDLVGIAGTNKAVLEVSSIPSLNLEKRLQYLIQYPHGCVEQTTSGVFPQLYLADLTDVDEKHKLRIEDNVKEAIKRLSTFQLSSGGLGYWPNSSQVSEWGTNYAGHFLIEAQKKGYNVSSSFMKKWKKYQRSTAKKWAGSKSGDELLQAYRLYTLALYNEPEMGAMNRLREKANLSEKAKWRLAAAYLLAGKKQTAQKLIENITTDVQDYNELSYTYGSGLRDRAMILETLGLMKDKSRGFLLLKDIAKQLGTEKWYSTQTTAYSLLAVSKFIGENKAGDKVKFKYSANGGTLQNFTTNKTIAQVDMPIDKTGGKVALDNTSGGVLFARLILEGIPEIGETEDADNNLKMEVSYKLMNGDNLNPAKIEQGTDFFADVVIKHTGAVYPYKEVALSQIFPSGWEIINTRLFNVGSTGKVSTPTYRDVRDDRVLTYFDIKKGETKTFRVLLNASYVGKFYLPTVYSEAMYDATINSRRKGMWVEVERK